MVNLLRNLYANYMAYNVSGKFLFDVLKIPPYVDNFGNV